MSAYLPLIITATVLLSCCIAQKPLQDIVRMSQEKQADISKNDVPDSSHLGTFTFAKYFQDHMVLQQAPKRANIYGFSPYIGQKVMAMVTTVSSKYYYTTTVKPGPAPGVGKWFFTLDPIKTAFPVSIYVASVAEILTLDDVLFGDVWLCSGQSNMVFTLSQMNDGQEEIANAYKYPDIRIMEVARQTATTPQYDLLSFGKKWSRPNSTTVRSFSSVCWLYGKAVNMKLGYPVGLISSDVGGTPVEAWSSTDALAQCGLAEERGSEAESKLFPAPQVNFEPDDNRELANFDIYQQDMLRGPQNNSVLWNAMIHPFLGLTFYGAIWYQGENDVIPSRMDHYNCTFPAMIRDWRAKFSQASLGQTAGDFFFGFVQLGPDAESPPVSTGYPDVRWHQTADVGYVPNRKMLNVFMGTAMDLSDFKSPYGPVHIRDKQDVAFRLSLAGFAIAYNISEVFQGPFPIGAYVGSSSYVLVDYGTRWALDVKNSFGFEVLCSLGPNSVSVWMPAPIIAYTTTNVTLQINSCGGRHPSAMRYAWLVAPCQFKQCAVYSTINALPAPVFIVYAFKPNHNNNHTVFYFD